MRRRRRGQPRPPCRVTLVIAAALAAACARDNDAVDDDDDARAEREDTTTARQAPDSAAPSMADGAIVDVALTANTMEVHISELARFRAQSSDVRRFAQTMVPDHSAMNGEIQSLAGRTGLAPVADERSNELRRSMNANYARLDSLRGAGFDQAYIEREVEYHESLIDLFDQTLIPAAQNPQLKTLLERLRPTLAAHLERARQIRAASAANAR